MRYQKTGSRQTSHDLIETACEQGRTAGRRSDVQILWAFVIASDRLNFSHASVSLGDKNLICVFQRAVLIPCRNFP